MNNARHFSRLAAYSLVVGLSGTAPALLADQTRPPCQDGHGMMGGDGMGPGMMGGYGMGPGMMSGYGMGPGMMGAYWGSGLDLTDDQQSRVNKIQDETRKSHWAMMRDMMNQQAKLCALYQAPKRDNAAIAATYKEFGKLQQKMYDSSVEAQKRMEAILTKEQQEKQQTYWRKGWAVPKTQ
ncbi:MAG: Spy/CpxP family protein refolding chaperone [Thiobacillus sp.]|nr:Spy/CpxP family protein refolding chaperone [Thiobacillus sp.]MDP1924167.1 Spy/CpxP family protein refolding chaperone [Thiobacillus sp.]MDP3126476.1 Spy/CpxP family protein refolding chaperone [Thiobacillus sp.]